MRRHLIRSGALLVLSVVATACGGDGPDVTVYSGRTEDLIGPLLEQFSDETGIDVDVRYGQSADLALLLDEEAEAGTAKADLFISQSPGAMGYLEDRSRLVDLPAPVLDLVPATVRDDESQWVGLTGRQRVLVYNTDVLDEASLPTSILELTDPAWKGKIGVAPANGSFQDFITAMRTSEGEGATMAFLEGLAANDPVSYANNNAIVEAVARGEVEVGLANHYYNFRRLAEDPASPTANHVFTAGDPGALLIITGAAVLDGSDHAEDATTLLTWLLGADAQRYFADETFEYPLAVGSTPSQAIPAIEFADVSGIDFTELGGGLARTREMITEAGFAG